MRIGCETIPDPHPLLGTLGTVVVAIQGTQACGDELVVTGRSEGTPEGTQDTQTGRHEMVVTGVKLKAVEPLSGSLILTALCRSLEILEALWYDYCTGHLNDVVQKYLATKGVLKEFDLTKLKLTTTITREEYIAARKFFLQGSGEHI